MGAWTVSAASTADLDHPDAWPLHGLELASRECERALWGHEDHVYRAASALGRLRNTDVASHHFLVVTPAGRVGDPQAVVGFAAAMLPHGDNAHLVWVEVWVRPTLRRRGLGRTLLGAVEGVAVAAGRTTSLLATAHVQEAGVADALVPPTGLGRIPCHDASTLFAADAGYRLEQGERYSVLDLPVPEPALAARHAEALAVAGAEHELVTWRGAAPQQWLPDLAELLTRAASDAPTAGLDFREDRWTPARIRRYEAQSAEAGRRHLTVGVVHRPTGRMVAMTTVSATDGIPEAVEQGYTIVLAPHRGHRLGMLVKSEMLRHLPDLAPEARRLRTWNAEENSHMLAINVALGFRPRGVHGMWQKTLVPEPVGAGS